MLRLVLLFGLAATTAAARTLEVGPGRAYARPSEAAAVAIAGDRIVIAPGEYADCAVLRADHLTLEGSGEAEATVLAGRTCEGKAILVVAGADITVRRLTLARASVADGNGAGIRAEGPSLVVEDVRFVDNQDGILTGGPDGATLVVRDSAFLRNGACIGGCAHGLYAGHLALLRVERSRFFETREAHHVKSRARRTEILGCDIADGAAGTASYLVELPNGGSLVLRDSVLQKGPHSSNRGAAIRIGAEGVTQATAEITVAGNSFRNDGAAVTVFVDNITATPAELVGNRLSGPVVALQGDGQVR